MLPHQRFAPPLVLALAISLGGSHASAVVLVHYPFDGDAPNEVNNGGSLGAAALNRVLPEALGCLDRELRPRVWHQCGDQHLPRCREQYREAGVDADVVAFIDDVQQA